MLLILVPLALGVVGCHGAVKPVEWSELGSESGTKKQAKQSKDSKKSEELRIVAKSNKEVTRLGPDDVVRIMQRIGFSDDQIVELGTDLRNALLQSGGAEVYYGKGLEMIMAVNNQQVQIQSRSRGSFVYDVARKRFVLGASPSGGGR
jgi:hypothetical protein